ncbi:hypothetical protein MRX96_027024 [Rhipicephalus microplus]
MKTRRNLYAQSYNTIRNASCITGLVLTLQRPQATRVSYRESFFAFLFALFLYDATERWLRTKDSGSCVGCRIEARFAEGRSSSLGSLRPRISAAARSAIPGGIACRAATDGVAEPDSPVDASPGSSAGKGFHRSGRARSFEHWLCLASGQRQ